MSMPTHSVVHHWKDGDGEEGDDPVGHFTLQELYNALAEYCFQLPFCEQTDQYYDRSSKQWTAPPRGGGINDDDFWDNKIEFIPEETEILAALEENSTVILSFNREEW